MKSILLLIAFLVSFSALAEDHPWPYHDQEHRSTSQHHDSDHSVNHHPNHYKNHKSHHLHGDAGTSHR